MRLLAVALGLGLWALGNRPPDLRATLATPATPSPWTLPLGPASAADGEPARNRPRQERNGVLVGLLGLGALAAGLALRRGPGRAGATRQP